MVEDAREGRGPLQGILAGLQAVDADVAFVASVDLPLLHPRFVAAVCRGADGADAAVPHLGGYRQPLAAAYRPALAPLVAELVEAGRMKPAFLFERCETRWLEQLPHPESVRNLNAREDYEAALAEPEPLVNVRCFGPLKRPAAELRAATLGSGRRGDGRDAGRARARGDQRRPDRARSAGAARRGRRHRADGRRRRRMSDRALAERLVRVAGAIALELRGGAAEVKGGGATDVVTEADRRAEAALVELLRAERPGDGVVGEEGAAVAGGERSWLLDPVDGTLNYARGLPAWCAAVCLVDAAGPLACAAFDPLAAGAVQRRARAGREPEWRAAADGAHARADRRRRGHVRRRAPPRRGDRRRNRAALASIP